MIPVFPQFKKLEIGDKEDVEKFTSKFPPYSDFNFVSMWSWDTKEEMRLSVLNNNLIVRFSDYLTGEPFYSFLGDNEVNGTVEQLLEFSKKENLNQILKLVPEISIGHINRSKFKILEDVDNMDYIISVDRLKPHEGKDRKLSSRRKMIEKLKTIFICKLVPIDISDEKCSQEILKVFMDWEQQRGVDIKDSKQLKEALIRMLGLGYNKNTLALGLYVNNTLIGYCINEILEKGYALGNFQQANLKFSSVVYAILMQETSIYLANLGCKLLNLEQDLGIEGLRKWKKSYNPVAFLKKYSIMPA